MFNLDQSINEWRQQMLAAGIKGPVPLDELESHLRDHVDQQMRSGVSAERAFESAVRQIGQAPELRAEFQKNRRTPGARLVQLIGIACAVIAFCFTLLIMPKLFHYAMGWTNKLLASAAIVTILLSWRYGYKVLPVIRNQKIRMLLGLVCCLASWMGMMLIVALMPFISRSVPSEISVGRWLLSFVWIWAAIAICGVAAHALEEAARRRGA